MPQTLRQQMEKVLSSRGDFVDFARAERMQQIYKQAKKDVSGNAECRRIGRMRIVLDIFLDELLEEVEGAETESA